MDFQLFALRFRFTAPQAIQFPAIAANKVRGGLGATLLRTNPFAYAQLFAPRSGGTGPSGLAFPPRPFVLRTRHLDGAIVSKGADFDIGVHFFDLRPAAVEAFKNAFAHWSPFAELSQLAGIDSPVRLVLDPSAEVVSRVIVRFLTPTELKGANYESRPLGFGLLATRIRDRLSTLSAFYGNGPLDIDFSAFGQRASRVQTVSGSVRQVVSVRRSRATGQTHSLGGFVGEVTYQGDLTEFLPYLQAAAFTGVGRQTVWGKGEIQVERVD